MEPDGFDGRVAVVTGGASGIGRAIARRFAAEGARVVVADVRRAPRPVAHFDREEDAPTDAIIREEGGEATFVETDVSDPEDARHLVERTVEQYGGIDVLVNNAGVDFDGTSQTVSVEDWRRVVGVNLDGAFYCSKYAVPHLVEAEGDLIAISSVMATEGGGGPPYASAKAGLLNLTRDLAVELGPEGVTVNAICPGYVRTAIQNRQESAAIERARRRTLVPRLGDPDDVAAVAAFLASEEAGFVHGAIVPVDGGWSAHRGERDASD